MVPTAELGLSSEALGIKPETPEQSQPELSDQEHIQRLNTGLNTIKSNTDKYLNGRTLGKSRGRKISFEEHSKLAKEAAQEIEKETRAAMPPELQAELAYAEASIEKGQKFVDAIKNFPQLVDYFIKRPELVGTIVSIGMTITAGIIEDRDIAKTLDYFSSIVGFTAIGASLSGNPKLRAVGAVAGAVMGHNAAPVIDNAAQFIANGGFHPVVETAGRVGVSVSDDVLLPVVGAGITALRSKK